MLTRLYGLLFGFLLVYCGVQLLWNSEWHKERLYHQLVAGAREGRFSAAMTLVDISGQTQLLRALRAGSAPVRQIATQALWDLWYHAAGADAYERVELVVTAMEARDYPRALKLADQLLEKYPTFAEAWNRRATLLWVAGRYTDSIADCRHALALNPENFGAWQGMGICQLHIGDVHHAIYSLRAAQRINPHDVSTLRLVDECRQYQRTHPRQPAHQADMKI